MSTAATITKRFLDYLKEEHLDELLPDIARELSKEAERRQVITVVSAAAFSKAESESLEKQLVAAWGEHDVVFTVDPSILSGFLVAFRDRVIDMSGRTALTDLSQHLS